MSEQQIFFKIIYTNLYSQGKLVSPRGFKVLEIENFHVEFPSYYRFINFKSRKLNLDYIKKEFLWYLNGNKFDLSIVEHAKLWKDMINKEGIIHSNYGQYIFGENNQFDYVIKTLKEDKDSRRAIISILNKDHVLSKDADLPCTIALSFRIRNNKLNMSVHMRSQDAIYGLASDLPCFSFIHEMIYMTLKNDYLDLLIGNYYHIVDSFHIYSKHFEMLDKIISQDEFEDLKCPKILNSDEVEFLRKNDFIQIPDEFLFAKWLNSYDNK